MCEKHESLNVKINHLSDGRFIHLIEGTVLTEACRIYKIFNLRLLSLKSGAIHLDALVSSEIGNDNLTLISKLIAKSQKLVLSSGNEPELIYSSSAELSCKLHSNST